MESAMNSTLVLLALYICSILHNGHKTIIEFIARLPLETEERMRDSTPEASFQLFSHPSQMANVA
jgi:hypothetical protein